MLDIKKIDLYKIIILSIAKRTSNMYNLFFDVLPDELQQYIYALRLDIQLGNLYYQRTGKKIELQQMIMKIPVEHLINTSIPGTWNNQIYYDPFDINVCVVASMALYVLTSREFNKEASAKAWWVSQLIRPIEIGLVMRQYEGGPNSYIYNKTEELCNKLITKFNVKAITSLS